MKIKEMFSELETRECYKEFKEKFPDSFLSAGFFMIGDGGNKFQLNFFLPNQKQIVSFEYPFASYKLYEDKIENEMKMDFDNLTVDLDRLEDFINKTLNKKVGKIIALIKGGIWNITCLTGFEVLRVKIDAMSGNVIEKSNGMLSDFVRFGKK